MPNRVDLRKSRETAHKAFAFAFVQARDARTHEQSHLLRAQAKNRFVICKSFQRALKRCVNLAKQDPDRQCLAEKSSKSRKKFLPTAYHLFSPTL